MGQLAISFGENTLPDVTMSPSLLSRLNQDPLPATTVSVLPSAPLKCSCPVAQSPSSASNRDNKLCIYLWFSVNCGLPSLPTHFTESHIIRGNKVFMDYLVTLPHSTAKGTEVLVNKVTCLKIHIQLLAVVAGS